MILTQDKYLVKYNSTDWKECDKLLYIIGKDKGKKFKNGSWLVSKETVENVLEVIPETNLIILPENFEIGSQMKLTLYDYQKDIVEFCLEKKNAIIAAACGAGKTAIVIDLFLDLKAQGAISPNCKGMIVVKSSLKVQWLKEIEKFSNLSAVIVDTFKGSTASIQSRISQRKKKLSTCLRHPEQHRDEITKLESEISNLEKEVDKVFDSQFDSKYDLYIVNYETLKDEKVRKAMHKVKLEFIGSDEVHLIKSDTSKRSKALYEFSHIKCKFGATATPIKKNPLDAYGITKFISPSTFKSKTSFSGRYLTYSGFGRVSGSKNEKELNEILSRFMIVKTKEEISSQLPELVVITRYCKLSKEQQAMSDQIMEEIKEYKEQERKIMAKYQGNPPGNDPELLKVQANIMARQTFASELADSEELLSVSDSNLAKNYITGSKSNKIETLLDLLDEIIESGEKAVIFSKYKRFQEILSREILSRFKDKKVRIAYVSGDLSAEDRYDEVYNKFRDDDEYKVLIMSDAGAEGISISWCKYLIEMEPADSYLIQTQRRGRIERADSIHDTVYVYQLIAEDSYDEVGIKIINKKEKYDEQIIKGNL